MAKKEHLEVLKLGVKAWNQWREERPDINPDLTLAPLDEASLREVNFSNSNLSGISLRKALLRAANFRGANLSGAFLSGAEMGGAYLVSANLTEATLDGADLSGADLKWADLSEASLVETKAVKSNLKRAKLFDANLSAATFDSADFSFADLSDANLTDADFSRANLSHANLKNSNLERANFFNTAIGYTLFANNDLRVAKGLETVRPLGPSTLGIDTMYKSGGGLPKEFLRACDIPDELITFIPSLVEANQAIQFYSCFISYSHKDEPFSKHLYKHLRDAQIRVWFAPEDIKGGEKLKEQIDRAIQIHDRLLLILSENSMKSEWVMTEIRRARKIEEQEHRRKLFPIRLTSYEVLKKWECFDSDSGRDLAREVREYYIPDFSNWEMQSSFKAAFEKLLRDLKAAEAGGGTIKGLQ